MPGTVLNAVAIPNVEEPAPVTVAGVKVGVAPAGSPLTLNDTVPANPPITETVAVYDVEPP